jgi:hypothetical protein
MNLTDLVPPLELCKLIPEGEFEYSTLIWMNGEVIVRFKDIQNTIPPSMQKSISPAPTLYEIMAKLPSFNCYKIGKKWIIGLVNDNIDNAVKSKNAETAALKLWLELKGIEHGE